MRKSLGARLLLYLVDACLADLGFLLAFLLRFGPRIPAYNLVSYLDVAPYIPVIALVVFWFFELYSDSWKRATEILYSVMASVVVINVATMALSFFTRAFSLPRTVFAIAIAVQSVLLGGWRIAWQGAVSQRDARRTVVVVGANGQGHAIARKLVSLSGGRIDTAEVVSLDAVNAASVVAAAREGQGVPAAERDEALAGADVVCVDASLTRGAREQVLSMCLEGDKEVILVPDLYDILVHNASVDRLDDLPVFRIGALSLTASQSLIKGVFDLALACVLLVPALPLMAVVAVVVRLSSPGPVLYVQERVGLNGRRFRLMKFRTMVRDAEENTGPVLATEGDPRLTRVGRVLRAARLDELPQILNILKGDMSFVGPRPERPFFVDRFSRNIPGYTYRLKVKPGVTGLAQVQGKYDSDPADKLRYDLYYLRNYSPLLDLQIMLQTLRVLFTPETARGTTTR